MEDAGRLAPGQVGYASDEMSTQRRSQDSDLRLVHPVLLISQAHQAQSEILADLQQAKIRETT